VPDLTVETPLGVLSFDHAGGVATPSGDPPVLATWQDAVADIQYGLYGHILDPSACFVSDLHAALSMVYGWESVAVSADCERRIKKEIAALPPLVVT
jgi:hypothetical protein